MPAVAGLRIDDLDMVLHMVLSQVCRKNTWQFIGLTQPLMFEWE